MKRWVLRLAWGAILACAVLGFVLVSVDALGLLPGPPAAVLIGQIVDQEAPPIPPRDIEVVVRNDGSAPVDIGRPEVHVDAMAVLLGPIIEVVVTDPDVPSRIIKSAHIWRAGRVDAGSESRCNPGTTCTIRLRISCTAHDGGFVAWRVVVPVRPMTEGQAVNATISVRFLPPSP
jgi:hypothetical protein